MFAESLANRYLTRYIIAQYSKNSNHYMNYNTGGNEYDCDRLLPSVTRHLFLVAAEITST